MKVKQEALLDYAGGKSWAIATHWAAKSPCIDRLKAFSGQKNREPTDRKPTLCMISAVNNE